MLGKLTVSLGFQCGLRSEGACILGTAHILPIDRGEKGKCELNKVEVLGVRRVKGSMLTLVMSIAIEIWKEKSSVTLPRWMTSARLPLMHSRVTTATLPSSTHTPRKVITLSWRSCTTYHETVTHQSVLQVTTCDSHIERVNVNTRQGIIHEVWLPGSREGGLSVKVSDQGVGTRKQEGRVECESE